MLTEPTTAHLESQINQIFTLMKLL